MPYAIGEAQARIVDGVLLLVRVDWMGVVAWGVLTTSVGTTGCTMSARPIADRLMQEELHRREGDSIDRMGVRLLARDVASAVARELAARKVQG